MLKTPFVAAFLLLAVSSVVLSQEPAPSAGEAAQPKQSEPAAPNNQSENDKRGTEHSPLIVKVQPTEKTEDERKAESDERQHKANLDRRLVELTGDLANYTLALFIATVVLAIATIGLLIAASVQSRDTKSAVRAANRQAKVAEDGLLKLQRAFITFQGIRYLSHRADDGSIWWSIRVNWLNSGASPAKQARFFAFKYFEDRDLPPDFPFAIPADGTSAQSVGPKVAMETGGDSLQVNASELLDVRAGRKFLYFWGRADYRDIFDGTQDHVTKFSIRVLDFRGDFAKYFDKDTNIVELVQSNTPPRHNCADEDCPSS